MLLVLQPLSRLHPQLMQSTTFIERFLFYRPGEIDIILTDLHSIIDVPPPGDESRALKFFHASLPDFLLDRSRSKDLFLDQGATYAKFTGLTLKHINNAPESRLKNLPGMSFPCCHDFCHSRRIKLSFIAYFCFVVSGVMHPRSSLRTCAV